MSMKGTPYYDMALDAGYMGEEAEQFAEMLAHSEALEYEEMLAAKAEAEAAERDRYEADQARD